MLDPLEAVMVGLNHSNITCNVIIHQDNGCNCRLFCSQSLLDVYNNCQEVVVDSGLKNVKVATVTIFCPIKSRIL